MLNPASEQELLGILEPGTPVHVIGSGTKKHHGPTAESGAPEVTVRGMSRITSYEPGDLVVTAQAGCRLSDLQAELGLRNQWLPIDPPYADATVGGVLATNSSGPRRLGYGTMRDHLLGLRVAGVGGKVTRSGGRVVKNVTGYDLHKLHVGAFGSLGILLEATFKLRPRPEIAAAFVFPCGSVPEAHELLLRVHGSKLRPCALEAMDGRLSHIVDGKALAIVGVDGSRPVIDRHYRELKEMAPRMGLLEGERAEPLWAALRKLPDALRSYVRLRIGARPHDLPKLLPAAPLWIQAGTAIARADLEPERDLLTKIQLLHQRAAAVGGYAVVESAPREMGDRDRLPWGWAGNPLVKAVKDRVDPRRVLNPGRVAL